MKPELASSEAWERYLDSLTPEERRALAADLAYHGRDTRPLSYVAAISERLDLLTAALTFFVPRMPNYDRWSAELEELEHLLALHTPAALRGRDTTTPNPEGA
jgi:hypothetical protein